MGFFVERVETQDKIVITFKKYALFVWGVLAFICLFLLSSMFFREAGMVLNVLFWTFLFVWIVPYLKTYREIHAAMRKKGVKMSGSKYSFSNPLIVEITK